MIRDDRQLDQAVEQLGRMYRALAALRRGVADVSPQQFALLSEGPLDEIARLQQQVAAYTGESCARDLQADVWIRIEGAGITWPEAPTSILTAFLDAFRKGVQSVAEFLITRELTTRPTTELKRACDMRVVALDTGSLRVGVRIPDEGQPISGGPKVPPVREALGEFLQAASWVASDESPKSLSSIFGNEQRQRVILNSLKPFLPRPRGDVELVELAGRAISGGRKIKLTKQATQRVNQAIDVLVSERVEEYVGDMREIDLDERSFILRNASEVSEIRCVFDDDLLETAKEALNRLVTVTGVRRIDERRRTSHPLRVTRLEIMDEAGSGTPAAG